MGITDTMCQDLSSFCLCKFFMYMGFTILKGKNYLKGTFKDNQPVCNHVRHDKDS